MWLAFLLGELIPVKKVPFSHRAISLGSPFRAIYSAWIVWESNWLWELLYFRLSCNRFYFLRWIRNCTVLWACACSRQVPGNYEPFYGCRLLILQLRLFLQIVGGLVWCRLRLFQGFGRSLGLDCMCYKVGLTPNGRRSCVLAGTRRCNWFDLAFFEQSIGTPTTT